MSPGLIINLIFVGLALYVYHRSWRLLHELLADSWSGLAERIRGLLLASGLTILFSAGTLMMVTGLTGLTNKLLMALQ